MKCIKCGKTIVDEDDVIIYQSLKYCFDCGVGVGGDLLLDDGTDIVLLTVFTGTKELIVLKEIQDLIKMYPELDGNGLKYEINNDNNDPLLFILTDIDGEEDLKKITRVGYVIKGMEGLTGYIKKLKLEDLVPDQEDAVETDKYNIIPMRTHFGELVCWRAEIKGTGEVVHLPLTGIIRGGVDDEEV